MISVSGQKKRLLNILHSCDKSNQIRLFQTQFKTQNIFYLHFLTALNTWLFSISYQFRLYILDFLLKDLILNQLIM
jgi:hypothetical protein